MKGKCEGRGRGNVDSSIIMLCILHMYMYIPY